MGVDGDGFRGISIGKSSFDDVKVLEDDNAITFPNSSREMIGYNYRISDKEKLELSCVKRDNQDGQLRVVIN